MPCLLSRPIIIFILAFSFFVSKAQPSNQRSAVIKTAKLYKGQLIEAVTPTADHKGAIVKTKDGQTYFLNREEAKQELNLVITDSGFIAPKDASVTYYNKNGVPADISQNDNSKGSKENILSKGTSIQLLYIINGKEATLQDLKQLNPNSIEKLNVLKGEAAVAKYGDRGEKGVAEITLKTYLNDTIPAQFPGGLDGWRRYLERNLSYPKAAQNNKTQGLVRVQIIVDEAGQIKEATALNDPGDGLVEEAVRVVKSGPAWIAATKNGKPIPYQFVQKITFSLSTVRQTYVSPFRSSQNIVMKTSRLYKGQAINYISTTEDLLGADVITTDMKSYFLNREEAMQQLGMLINEKGFVAPEDAKVVYTDNNGVAMESYHNLRFVGGNRSFRIYSLYKKGTNLIDVEKQPIILLNGKEATAEQIQAFKSFAFRSTNLVFLQEEPARAAFGERGKNGILILSTKIPVPDNYLYLLNGKESSNEEIAALEPGTIDSMITMVGKRAVEQYGEKAKYGIVRCITKKAVSKNIYDQVFSNALNPAVFPGGSEGWKKYIGQNLRYPAAAKKTNTEATVRVKIIIGADGIVTKAYPMNDPGNGMAQEAVRLLTEGPKWTPATYNGQNVSYTLMMSVPFKLDSSDYL